MERYDVIICGAGPGGCMLARTLGDRKRVLLVEKRNLRAPMGQGHEKSCGGMLNLAAQETLAALGMPLPKEILVSPQVFCVRAVDFDAHAERTYQKQYVNIDREKLERWLLGEALQKDNVFFANETELIDFKEQDREVVVTLRDGDRQTSEVRCSYLVGADGAGSIVRRRLEHAMPGPDEERASYRTYASLQTWYESDRTFPYFAAFFDRSVTDYYAWMIPKEKTFILGAAIPNDRDVRHCYNLLKARVQTLGFDLSKPIREKGALLIRPYGPGSVCLGKNHVFLIGEAAALISASSEEGISYAMRSGHALAKAVLGGGDANQIMDAYGDGVRALKYGLFLKNAKADVMYNPVLRKLIFKSGLLSMKTERES